MPVILATFPVIDGVPRSLEFFNIVFFAVLVSTVLQGSTVELLAARLGLTDRDADLAPPAWDSLAASAAPDAIAPLREREFCLLFSGQTVSLIGDNLAPIALAFAILDAGGSATDVGVVYASNIIARVAFILVGGVWADRLSRHRVMLAADALRAISSGILAYAVLSGDAPLGLYIAMVVAHGIGAAFFNPASTGLVPQTVSAPHPQQANALLRDSPLRRFRPRPRRRRRGDRARRPGGSTVDRRGDVRRRRRCPPCDAPRPSTIGRRCAGGSSPSWRRDGRSSAPGRGYG